MAELFNELQQCYGSVRYRRQLELRSPPPIQLDKLKRPSGTRTAEGFEGQPLTTPPGGYAVQPGQPAPILLTKRKERKRTLPMDIGINENSPAPGPAARPAAELPNDGPDWLSAEEEEPTDAETDEWSDIDIDAHS
jgi:hypothetical protein